MATKPATGVTTDVAIVVAEDPDRPDFVSRGGHKLGGRAGGVRAGRAGRRRPPLPGRRGLHRRVHRRAAAARRRARWWRSTSATASWRGGSSRTSGSSVRDRTNVRDLSLELVGDPVDLVVGDLSFISLSLVLDALLSVTAPDGDLALMVKPQFEVGKDRVGKGGVVRDPALRAEAVNAVADAAAARGLGRPDGHHQPAAGAVRERRVLPVAAPRPGGHRYRPRSSQAVRAGVGAGAPGEKVDP